MAARNEVFVLWNLPKPNSTELRRVAEEVSARVRSTSTGAERSSESPAAPDDDRASVAHKR